MKVEVKQPNKRIIIAGNVVIIAVWTIWCAFFLARGFDFTDQGLYVSEAWRFSQGDLVFRDSLAAWGLPFWWVSLVFRVFPGISFLGLSILWAVVMLACALVTANLVARYFNPVLSFAGALVGLFMATSGAIKTLCYNSMPALGLLLAAWLWLSACNRNGRSQVFMAGGAGLIAFLATTCRFPVIPIVLLPLLTIVYDRCCGIKTNNRLRATITFMATYMVALACLLLIIQAKGLMSDFLGTFTLHTSSQGHSVPSLISNVRDSCLYYLTPTFLFLAVILVKRYKTIVAFTQKHSRITGFVVLPIVIVGLLVAIWQKAAIYKVLQWMQGDIKGILLGTATTNDSNRFLIALAIGVVMIDVIFHVSDSKIKGSKDQKHRIYRLGIVSVFLVLLMIAGSGNVPAAYSMNYMSWLAVALMVCLLWLWSPKPAKSTIKKVSIWLYRTAFILFVLFFSYRGLLPDFHPYRDGPVNKLVTMPESTKLHGMYTTSERAQIVDKLVTAVELNSKAGDRILAYENLPMLYYLTDRLPSTSLTWLTDGFPRSLRERLLEDMIKRDRLPKLVIRASYTVTDPGWPVVKAPLTWQGNQQETDPIDKYIREHYKVIQEIEGFQVMVPVDTTVDAGH
jgi:hypothetical protein